VEPPGAGGQTGALAGQWCRGVSRRRHSDEGRMPLLYSDMQRNACFSRRRSTRWPAGAAGQSSARAAAEAVAARVAMTERSASSALWADAPTSPAGEEAPPAEGRARAEDDDEAEVAGPEVTVVGGHSWLDNLTTSPRGGRSGPEPPPASGGCDAAYSCSLTYASRFFRTALASALKALTFSLSASVRSSSSFATGQTATRCGSPQRRHLFTIHLV
jgi:hypothetical protein